MFLGQIYGMEKIAELDGTIMEWKGLKIITQDNEMHNNI